MPAEQRLQGTLLCIHRALRTIEWTVLPAHFSHYGQCHYIQSTHPLSLLFPAGEGQIKVTFSGILGYLKKEKKSSILSQAMCLWCLTFEIMVVTVLCSERTECSGVVGRTVRAIPCSPNRLCSCIVVLLFHFSKMSENSDTKWARLVKISTLLKFILDLGNSK